MNSAFSPDQFVLNFCSAATLLQCRRCKSRLAPTPPPSLVRRTNRPVGHQMRYTKRLIIDTSTSRRTMTEPVLAGTHQPIVPTAASPRTGYQYPPTSKTFFIKKPERPERLVWSCLQLMSKTPTFRRSLVQRCRIQHSKNWLLVDVHICCI